MIFLVRSADIRASESGSTPIPVCPPASRRTDEFETHVRRDASGSFQKRTLRSESRYAA